MSLGDYCKGPLIDMILEATVANYVAWIIGIENLEYRCQWKEA